MTQVGLFADGLRQNLIPINTISIDDSNARIGNVDAIAKSYAMFGQRKPIVTTMRHGTLIVIAGNHQLLAARQLGWTHIAAITIEESDERSTAFAVADNLTHDLGSYNLMKLSALMDSLAIEGIEHQTLGFDDLSMQDIAAMVNAAPDDAEVQGISDRYADFTKRTLVVRMSIAEFECWQSKLAQFCEAHGVASNAEAMVQMFEIAFGEKAPAWN